MNGKVFCPYCKAEQNDLNIKKPMFTSKDWIYHECDKCHTPFGYLPIVKRAYITAKMPGGRSNG